MKREVMLRVVLQQPPSDVDIGVQKGKGNEYETVQVQRRTGKDLVFEFPIQVAIDPDSSELNFSGPFAQGPKSGRFVYLDIGTAAGQQNTRWNRRLKIPLFGITGKMAERGLLETHVRGTGKDGGPACGTVKPFDGWRAR